MFNDLFTSIRQGLDERVRNPFLGAFIIAWFAWNWRVVALFFDSMPFDDKMALFPVYSHCYPIAAGVPFLFAVGYVLLMPWIAYLFQWATGEVTRRRKEYALDASHRLLEKRARNAAIKKRLDGDLFDSSERVREIEAQHSRELSDRDNRVHVAERKCDELNQKIERLTELRSVPESELAERVHSLEIEIEELSRQLQHSKDSQEGHRREVRRLREENQDLRKRISATKPE